MVAPRQMTANTLNALKGWPSPHAVDFNATYDPGCFSLVTTVLAGMCVHLTQAGQYALGVGNLKAMPLFMFNNSDDPDVVNDGGNAAITKGVWVAIAPTGQALALVANGAYELTSTAFVAGTYNPNDHLTSDVSGANAGLLRVGTIYTNCIVGLVSRGVVDNGYGFNAVAFWPLYLPPNP
jgi:hypothetical protein